MTDKKILEVHNAPSGHWVGDGFPVRSLLSPQRLEARESSPFLLLDYGAPREFAPAETPRGVGSHPHKGFETVTVVYQGEVEHRDSTGAAGRIGPGDVQWMTAGAGIVHEEMHSRRFTAEGGTFEMVQLWVNLPARDKGAPPGYQTLLASDIPVVELAAVGSGTGGRARVIAGELAGSTGPARTFTPIALWDVRLPQEAHVQLPLPDGWTTLVAVLAGEVRIGEETAGEAELVLAGRDGDRLEIEARADSTLLVLAGEPIDEPVVSHGPFVMNTREEISEAIADFQSGRMGRIGAGH